MEMTREQAISTIIHWIGCDTDTAKMIFNGVFEFDGNNYSAYIVEGEKLEICKNGFPIHKISKI
ncbi:MAG: hypothetical protein K1W18_07185 [Oscillospiraceae bacterium]